VRRVPGRAASRIQAPEDAAARCCRQPYHGRGCWARFAPVSCFQCRLADTFAS
jgi:hypothetical protein